MKKHSLHLRFEQIVSQYIQFVPEIGKNITASGIHLLNEVLSEYGLKVIKK